MIDTLPMFAGLDAGTRARVRAGVRRVDLKGGNHAFAPGAACGAYLVVLSGVVRVQIVAETGREIILYRVGPGESCVLTTSCLFRDEPYSAEAICESDVVCAAIPRELFAELLGTSVAFREAVLAGYAARVTDLILTLEEVAFRRLDLRLANALLARGASGRVVATHQELAAELGSAREVISRTLKSFEARGLVALGRGEVVLRDREALKALTRQS